MITQLLFLIILSYVKSQVQQLSIDTQIFSSNTKGGYKYYSISNLNKSLDLIIQVKPDDRKIISDPDLYISKSISSPSKLLNDWSSDRFGEDLIIVDRKYLKVEKPIYIGVYCEDDCEYSLLVSQTNETVLNLQSQYVFGLQKDQSMVISYTDTLALNDSFQIIAHSTSFSYFKMLVSINSNPTNESTLDLNELFIGGYVFNYIMDKNSDKLTFKILLFAEEETDLVLRFQSSSKSTIVKRNQRYFGTNKNNEQFCYLLETGDIKEDLILVFDVFQGNLMLRVNFEDQSNNNFKYDFDLDDNELIILKKNELKSNLYFCVSSKQSSQFSFVTYISSEISQTQKFNELYSGIKTNGLLLKNQVTSYQLVDDESIQDIEIRLNSILAETKLYIYYCKGEKYCLFDQKTLKEKANELISPQQQLYSIKSVKLSDKDNYCHILDKINNTHISCKIIAVVECISERCEYTLSSIDNSRQVILTENTATYHLVEEGKFTYFKFTIPKNENIINITIFLNQLSGEADLYVSSKNPFPNNLNFDEKSISNEYSPDLIVLNKKSENRFDLSGNHYLGVYGRKTCFFSIIYYTTISKLLTQIYLTEGFQHKDKISSDQENFKVYSIDSVKSENYNGYDGLIINLTPEVHQYEMYFYSNYEDILFNFETKKFSNYLKKSLENQLIILNSDPFYKPGKRYFIVIGQIQKSGESKESYYYISYNMINKSLMMVPSYPLLMTLTNNNKYQKFLYYIHSPKKDTSILLSLNILSGFASLYADFEKELLISNYDSAKFKEINSVNKLKTLKFTKEDFKDCVGLICPLSIFVQKDDLFTTQFIFDITQQDSKAIHIMKGITLTREVVSGEIAYFFYRIVNPGESLKFVLNKIYGNTTLVANLNKGQTIDYPTLNNYQFKGSNIFKGENIFFQSSDTQNCPCVLIVGVIGGSYSSYFNNKFSLSLLGLFNKIKMDEIITSYVSSDNYNYYLFDFDSQISNLYISLRQFYGKTSLYVNYGGSVPTKDNYHWKSTTTLAEIIDFGIDSQFFKDNNITSMFGTYIIGVYGQFDSKYNLFVTSHQKKLVELSEDVAVSGLIRTKGDYSYFKFTSNFHKSDPENFAFLLTTQYVYGKGKILVNLYNSSQVLSVDQYVQLPSHINYTWSSENSGNYDFLLIKISKKYLDEQGYGKFDDYELTLLISVYSYEPSLFEIFAGTQKNIQKGIILNEDLKEKLYYLEKDSEIVIDYFPQYSNVMVTSSLLIGKCSFEIFEKKNSRGILTQAKKTQFNLNRYNDHFNYKFKSNLTYQPNDTLVITSAIKAFEDTGVFIKYEFVEDIYKIPIEKSENKFEILFTREQQVFRGYIVSNPEYNKISIEISPLVRSFSLKELNFYAKFKFVNITEINGYYNDIPSFKHFDISESLDLDKNTMKINLSNYETIEKTKIGIYLISIHVLLVDSFDSDIFRVGLKITPEIKKTQWFTLKSNEITFKSLPYKKSGISHIYQILGNPSNSSFSKIRISECGGKLGFMISDTPDFSNHSMDNNFYYKDGLYQSFVKSKNQFLNIWTDIPQYNITVCEDKPYRNCSLIEGFTDYMLFFNNIDINDFEDYSISNNGIIDLIQNEESIEINWLPVMKTNYYGSSKKIEIISNLSYRIGVVNDSSLFSSMQSWCFLLRTENFMIKDTIIDTYKYAFKLSPGNYSLNIITLVQNVNSPIAYIPIMFEVKNPEESFFFKGIMMKITILSVVVVLLIVIALCFYIKYRKIKIKYQTHVKEVSVAFDNTNLPGASRLESPSVVEQSDIKHYNSLSIK